jgi:hypothetical protein
MDAWLPQKDVTDEGVDQKMVEELVASREKIEAANNNMIQASGLPLDSLFPNDEHKGMDQKQQEEHVNLTKLKTINYV